MEKIDTNGHAPRNYDTRPVVKIQGLDDQAWAGWKDIGQELRQKVQEIRQGKNQGTATCIAIDCYAGVFDQEVLGELTQSLKPDLVIHTDQALKTPTYLDSLLERCLTDDRVFATMTSFRIQEFFDPARMDGLGKQVREAKGLVLVYGTGASLFCQADLLVYADMPRWELQLRYRRKEACNWGAKNHDLDFLKKYKRGYFVEWRMLDRHKTGLFGRMNYLLDTTMPGKPRMLAGKAHLEGLKQTAHQPFRLLPFFDPGPWGGQWMKEVCQLDSSVSNYAWCFDCVPEENSLVFQVRDIQVEIPAINLVLSQPVALLGDKVHARFGAEFPIRFDFLDTMDGGNLSLQVHPLTEYIQQEFGMHYTQDESYYILDAKEDASVFLGVKSGIKAEAMVEALQSAQQGGQDFPAGEFINQWPARKHDHFLIPAGTLHCSGRNAMVLEISATPYIFTFKLWDWGRLGLDGKPRPIHLEHGIRNIQWHRDTQWVKDNLVNRISPLSEGNGWKEERTGLHEREFIETRRTWFVAPVLHDTQGGVNVLNLVEGEAAIVESPENRFAPFEVHYAETFVIPAAVGEYRIRPAPGTRGPLATIKAYVRT